MVNTPAQIIVLPLSPLSHIWTNSKMAEWDCNFDKMLCQLAEANCLKHCCFSCRTVILAYKWRKAFKPSAFKLLNTLKKPKPVIWDVNLLNEEWETWVLTSLQRTDQHHHLGHNLLHLSPPSFSLISLGCLTHLHLLALLCNPGRVDPSLSPGLVPSHRRPALAVCWCTMAWWDAEGCRGGL